MSEIDFTKLDVLTDLPCGEDIRRGLEDLSNSIVSVESCLAAIASPRLTEAGLLEKTIILGDIDSEHTLYHLLESHGEQAHSAYNSRLQELVSFENALDHRLRWDNQRTA